MAEDLISSVIDQAAVDRELKTLSGSLDALLVQIKSFSGVKINLEGASNVKQLVAANNEYSTSLNGVKQSQNDLDSITQRVTARIAALNGHSKELTQQILLEARASKELALAKLAEEKARIANEAAARKEAKASEAAAKAAGSNFDPNSVPFSSNVNADGTIKSNEALASSIHAVSEAEREQAQALLASGLPIQTSGTNKKAASLANKEFAASEIALAKAESAENVALQQNKILTADANKFAKQEALEKLGLVDAYQKLTAQLSASQIKTKALAAEFGVESIQAKAAAKETLALDTQVKAIDKSVGQSQRNVGNYGSAFNKAFSGVRTLANILPGIGLSGLFLLAFEAIRKAVDILGIFNVKLSDTAKESKLMSEINEKSAKSFADSAVHIEVLQAKLNDLTISQKDRILFADQYNKVADEGNKIDITQINNLNEVNKQITKQISLLKERAIAKAAENVLSEKAEALFKAQTALQETEAANPSINEDALKLELSRAQKLIDAFHKNPGTQKLSAKEALAFADLPEAELQEAIRNNQRLASLQDAELVKLLKSIATRKKLIDDARAGNRAGSGGLNIKGAQDDVKAAQEEFDKALKLTAKLITLKTEVTKGDGGKGQLQELKKVTDNTFEIYKSGQDAKIKLFDEIVKSDKSTFSQRIQALQDFTDASKELIDKQAEHDIAAKREETKREVNHLNETKSGKSTAEQARINQNIVIANFNLRRDIALIEVNAHQQSLDLEHSVSKDREKIVSDGYKKIGEAGKKAYEEIAAAIKKTQADSKNENEISKNNQLLKLDKDLQDGKIKNAEEYNRAKKNIEDDAIKKDILDDEKRILAEEAMFGVSLDLERQFSDDDVKLHQTAADKKKQIDEDYVAKRKQLEDELQKTIVAFVEGGFDKQKNAVQDQINLVDEQSKREIDAVNASNLAEQDKANRINIINIQSQKQKEQLDKRQRQIDQERARFERALSIVQVIQNTAAAVTKDLVGNKFLIPFDIAIGAAQIAAILARPIPKFFKGTENAPKGLGVFGEYGSELVVPKSGKPYLSPNVPTLTSFMGGEKIYSHDITKDILGSNNLFHLLQRVNKRETIIENPFGEKVYNELKQLNKKPSVTNIINPAYEGSAHYNYHIKR